MPHYKNPEEALAGTTALAQPTNEAQRQAIAQASALVPITPSSLTPSQPITLPQKPQPTIPQITAIPTLQTQEQPADTQPDIISQLLSASTPPPRSADTYQSLLDSSGIGQAEMALAEKNSRVNAAQAKYSGISAQLATLAQERQAIDLQLAQTLQSDQAKGGISTFQLNANQQATQRIANQAKLTNAIQTFPLQGEALVAQSEVLSAQGDARGAQEALDRAQSKFDQVFQIHMQDAQNQYNYQKEIRDRVYDYVTTKEKEKLNAQQRADDRKFEIQQNSISNAQALSRLALENGQSTLAGQITSLDPSSPTFTKDLANLQSKILIQKATKAAEAPTVKTINGVDMQWNPSTGQWENIGGALDITSPQVQKSKDQFGLIFQTIKNLEDPEISGASGRSTARQVLQQAVGIGPGDFGDLVSLANTMRTNMLILQTDPSIKKFFGPQMSNADVQLMTSAGTTLNPELQSPKALREEVARIKDLVSRARLSLDGVTTYGTTPSGIRVGIYPDGTIRDTEGNEYDKDGKRK